MSSLTPTSDGALRVAFVAPFGLAPKGTVSVRALPLARALAARGHQVTVFVPPWNDRTRSGQVWEEAEAGVRVVNLRLPPHPALDPPLLAAALVREVGKADPHVVHAFKPKAYSGLVAAVWWWLSRLGRRRARVVVDADDWEGRGGWNELEPYPAPLKWAFARQEHYGLTHAHGVTVASRALETLVWSLGVPPERVCYVPNGPGLSLQARPSPERVVALRAEMGLEGRPVVLLYTRFFEFDVARLAQVWGRVVAACPDARLLVVGRGLFGEEVRFAEEVRRMGLGETLVQAGWVPAREVADHLALAHVALYPMDDTLVNRAKCPVKLADLLALEVPVVGEAVGQVAEYLADGAGVLVPPGDVARFARAVVSLLRDPEQARRLGRAGRQRLERHFAWSVQAGRVEALYRRLLAPHST